MGFMEGAVLESHGHELYANELQKWNTFFAPKVLTVTPSSRQKLSLFRHLRWPTLAKLAVLVAWDVMRISPRNNHR